jgi:hypothetical protein
MGVFQPCRLLTMCFGIPATVPTVVPWRLRLGCGSRKGISTASGWFMLQAASAGAPATRPIGCAGVSRRPHSLSAVHPPQQIAHRARLQQLAVRRLQATPLCLPAALIPHPPGHRRLDLPAAVQQRLAGLGLVKAHCRPHVRLIRLTYSNRTMFGFPSGPRHASHRRHSRHCVLRNLNRTPSVVGCGYCRVLACHVGHVSV